MNQDLVFRLRKRAEIRLQISTRKSVQENKPDRLVELLLEAADALDKREQSTSSQMNLDDIIRMAEQAGFKTNRRMIWVAEWEITPYLQRFAALVTTAEREQCAQLVETFDTTNPNIVAAAIRSMK